MVCRRPETLRRHGLPVLLPLLRRCAGSCVVARGLQLDCVAMDVKHRRYGHAVMYSINEQATLLVHQHWQQLTDTHHAYRKRVCRLR